MPSISHKSFLSHHKSLILVYVISFLIALILAVAIWDANYWPTDTEMYYFDAVRNIPHLQYISDIHKDIDEERTKWLHGKEVFIIAASFFQRLLNDPLTLRPYFLVCLVSVGFSSILIYIITRNFWGSKVGWVCYFFFTASFWPYLYILFAKHHPLGLFCFLFAFFLVQSARYNSTQNKAVYFFSGALLSCALFASSVSVLYLPYYFSGVLYRFFSQKEKSIKQKIWEILSAGIFIFIGAVVVVIYINLPDVIGNIKEFFTYVEISGKYNHFFYNQMVLQQWFKVHPTEVRGGWLWIGKYFFLIMPVLFPVFVAAVVYLLCQGIIKQKNWLATLAMIALSVSSPLLAELRGVAQYGGNYFTSIVGIIMLVGYAFHVFLNKDWVRIKNINFRRICVIVLAAVGLFHFAINFYIFVSDIYPTRMATTFISKKLKQLGINEVYAYGEHPHAYFIYNYLNPEILAKTRFVGIEYLIQVNDDHILVPPITGDSIYIAATSDYTDFDDDIFLNELVKRDLLETYAVASFKSLASSRIWPHEEEILSYRYLILNQWHKDLVKKGKVWLLDVAKIAQDWSKNFPSSDSLYLQQTGVRNIGTKSRVYMYEGFQGEFKKITLLKAITARIHKVGNPRDSLKVYVFKVDEKQTVWVNFGKNYASEPLEAQYIPSDKEDNLVILEFPTTLMLKPGMYYFAIYRTGEPSDQDFYRIQSDYFGKIE